MYVVVRTHHVFFGANYGMSQKRGLHLSFLMSKLDKYVISKF